jgi:hypothetical protein
MVLFYAPKPAVVPPQGKKAKKMRNFREELEIGV